MNSNNQMITGQTNELRMQVQDAAVNAHKWMTCLNCIHWHKRTEIDMRVDPPTRTEVTDCGMFNAMPPPHIIVSGCKDHEFDIPF